MCGFCQIVPPEVLKRFAKDESLTAAQRKGFADTAKLDARLRRLRVQAGKVTQMAQSIAPLVGAVAPAPAILVDDCKNGQTLPGVPIANPVAAADPVAKRVFAETGSVAAFYQQVFGRNSVDNAGTTLVSSIHYGSKYPNAFWNGTQMTYGDGDGAIFVDFSRGNDVIGHELTHGVTQHTLQLNYVDQPGGLNESLSDCFGSMFRQWEAGQDVTSADWLIGADIMGPAAKAKGYTCLRDMAKPDAPHCLSPQPTNFKAYQDGMDPHVSSGIPNLAFYEICNTICGTVKGKSWEKVGQIWYKALTGFGPKPNMTMREFADQTRMVAAQLYPGDSAVAKAVDGGWKQVGL